MTITIQRPACNFNFYTASSLNCDLFREKIKSFEPRNKCSIISIIQNLESSKYMCKQTIEDSCDFYFDLTISFDLQLALVLFVLKEINPKSVLLPICNNCSWRPSKYIPRDHNADF